LHWRKVGLEFTGRMTRRGTNDLGEPPTLYAAYPADDTCSHGFALCTAGPFLWLWLLVSTRQTHPLCTLNFSVGSAPWLVATAPEWFCLFNQNALVFTILYPGNLQRPSSPPNQFSISHIDLTPPKGNLAALYLPARQALSATSYAPACREFSASRYPLKEYKELRVVFLIRHYRNLYVHVE
jgi:hypothetical protein